MTDENAARERQKRVWESAIVRAWMYITERIHRVVEWVRPTNREWHRNEPQFLIFALSAVSCIERKPFDENNIKSKQKPFKSRFRRMPINIMHFAFDGWWWWCWQNQGRWWYSMDDAWKTFPLQRFPNWMYLDTCTHTVALWLSRSSTRTQLHKHRIRYNWCRAHNIDSFQCHSLRSVASNADPSFVYDIS